MAKSRFERSWQENAAEVWVGLADWRAAHPKATFREIEEEVDRRLMGLRARVLGDVAMASAAVGGGGGEDGTPGVCGRCGGSVKVRGSHERGLSTLGGASVRLKRSYVECEACGAGFFPPR